MLAFDPWSVSMLSVSAKSSKLRAIWRMEGRIRHVRSVLCGNVQLLKMTCVRLGKCT